MAKSKPNNHEYYANYETCRNNLFDLTDVDEEQGDFLDYTEDVFDD